MPVHNFTNHVRYPSPPPLPGNLVVSKEGRKRQSSDLSRKRPNTPQNGDFKTISFYAKTHYPQNTNAYTVTVINSYHNRLNSALTRN